MKMLKKLLAVVLTGAMALTLLTACGGNAVTEKDIADAMNDMAKAAEEDVTFTPRAKEREMARNFATLAESKAADGKDIFDDEFAEERKNILGCNDDDANANNFVWVAGALTDKIGASGQAFQLLYQTMDENGAENAKNLKKENKTPADDRYMGTALCKALDENGKQVTKRIIVVTAEAVDE